MSIKSPVSANPNANSLIISHHIGYHTKKAKTLVFNGGGVLANAFLIYDVFGWI